VSKREKDTRGGKWDVGEARIREVHRRQEMTGRVGPKYSPRQRGRSNRTLYLGTPLHFRYPVFLSRTITLHDAACFFLNYHDLGEKRDRSIHHHTTRHWHAICIRPDGRWTRYACTRTKKKNRQPRPNGKQTNPSIKKKAYIYQRRQEFLQGGTHELHEEWPFFFNDRLHRRREGRNFI
jgi:hypothetical protein